MKKKRVNPNKRPVTVADVNREKRKAKIEAIEFVWSIFFTVLSDKEGYDIEGLKRVWMECENLSESIAQGYCTVKDLQSILREEMSVYITDGGNESENQT